MKRLLIVLIINLLVITGILLIPTAKPEDPYEEIPNPMATITMEDGSKMTAELFLTAAPNTVSNFVVLANSGFYDGLSFYRIVNNVFIQTGDPTETRFGGADYTIEGEFAANHFDNPISHERGVLSLSRQPSDVNSGSSQFFIMQGYYSEYDGQYAAFGKLVGDESYATLDVIGSTPTDGNRRPLVPRRIDTIRVETFGYEYSVVKYPEK